ncbi:hypothetical protein WJX81_004644 [Elliptochloris bilobata]|uniref:Pseudouridine-5'-phosphate glycosidase n=1 Tax=Elliptochloris bilobata TaxID=381761 RepID=A0AAW1RCM1_9CHLO
MVEEEEEASGRLDFGEQGAGSVEGSVEHGLLRYSPEVWNALQARAPVVALESTIISHGMPFPQNLETALQVEAIIREHGATPATIAVLDGHPHIGLTLAQLHRIASGGRRVRKTSRRDLPAVMASRADGATTVSATMLLASQAGIPFFVTGGLGGVHRGGEVSMDVSADLIELSRTPVAVVCAGAKTVLDIPRTLEVLETQGVCVAAYGADEFPAFFARSSGCRAPARVDSPAQAAALARAAWSLGPTGFCGVLIGVPIPAEHEAQGAAIERAIKAALGEAESSGVSGSDVTPFLLKRVAELTGGASLAANIMLIKHNAAIGAQIAVAYHALP